MPKRSKLYEYKGTMLTVPEIAEKLEMSIDGVYKRLAMGKSLEDPILPLHNHKIMFRGKKRPVKEIAGILDMSEAGIYNRIYNDITLDNPKDFHKRLLKNAHPRNFYMFRGKERTVKEIAKILDMSENTIYSRIRIGKKLDCPVERNGK